MHQPPADGRIVGPARRRLGTECKNPPGTVGGNARGTRRRGLTPRIDGSSLLTTGSRRRRAFLTALTAHPFREVTFPLLGDDRVLPCPVCRTPGTRLDLLGGNGRCYGGCG